MKSSTLFFLKDKSLDDNYEFEQKKIMGKKIHLSNKPHWYYYYRGRNLLLIALHTEFKIIRFSRIIIRLNFELIAIIIGSFKNQPIKAFYYFSTGFIHGLMNKRGKWKIPN